MVSAYRQYYSRALLRFRTSSLTRTITTEPGLYVVEDVIVGIIPHGHKCGVVLSL